MTENTEPELTRHPLAEEHFGKLVRHEFEGLKQGLRDHSQGARVWLYQGRVLCGWHTHLACRELGLEPEYVAVEAADDGEALLKALSVELRRRSLTEQQRCAIWFRAADRIPPLRAAMDEIGRDAGDRRRAGLKRGKEEPSREPQVEAGGKAATRVGELLGVSRAVVERDRRLFGLSPSWHAAVAGGARFDTAIRKAATKAKIERLKSLPPVDRKDIRLFTCDFRDLEREAGIVPHSVRLVVLDPPYFEDYVEHYRAVAELAARWLDPRNGMLVAFVGSRWLPDIIAGMSRHLCWHWLASVFYGQTGGQVRGRLAHRVRECQRPVLVFRAGKDAKPLTTFNDVIECRTVEKEWDEWQQPLKAVRHYVEAFTEPGDLVVDTHGGAFTTAVACQLTKRRYAGCDLHKEQVEKGKLRLREAAHEHGGPEEIANEENSQQTDGSPASAVGD